jgi:hypothetical protein
LGLTNFMHMARAGRPRPAPDPRVLWMPRARVLVDDGAGVSKARHDDGATPLFAAVLAGHVEVVRLLLSHMHGAAALQLIARDAMGVWGGAMSHTPLGQGPSSSGATPRGIQPSASAGRARLWALDPHAHRMC